VNFIQDFHSQYLGDIIWNISIRGILGKIFVKLNYKKILKTCDELCV